MLVQRLKERKGASIAVALLVLLICVTAGAAALTAAGANAGRYTHLRRDQQRYLAVASAARAVRDELGGRRFTAAARVVKSNSYTDPETLEVTYGDIYTMEPADRLIGASYTGALADWLLEPLGELFQAVDIPDAWWSQTGLAQPEPGDTTLHDLGFQVGDSGDEPLLSQVHWTLTLEDDYTLTARFWLEDDGAEYYPTVLTLPAEKSEELLPAERVGASQRWVTKKTVEVSWNADEAVITQS